MKKLLMIFSLILCVSMLIGCAGTPVIYHADCDCPSEGGTASQNNNNKKDDLPVPEGALKTGLALVADISGSTSASDKDGEGKYDVTMVAVLVDEKGVIADCIIDGIAASVKFDASGKISGEIPADVKTKNELGADYGMLAWGKAIAEWDVQAQALADYAVGKTVKELRSGAVSESGYAPDGSDLASSATIYLGGYVSAIEKAVANATHLGAEGGDTLKMASKSSLSGSDAGEKNGNTQLETTVAVLTLKDGSITSCAFDSVQAKVEFDTKGVISNDIKSVPKTKNELGPDYGMVAWGKAIAEWNEQAASLAKYVTGKTLAEVSGISVNEGGVPTEADLVSSVTIAIGDFRSLIEKAAK